MGFPFTIAGEIPMRFANQSERDSVVERVNGGLLALQVRDIQIVGNRLTFSMDLTRMFFGFGNRTIVSGGEVEVGPVSIRYEFATKTYFLVMTAFAAAAALWAGFDTRSPVPLLVFPLFVFAIFSIHYVIEQSRLLSALTGTARGAAVVDPPAGMRACPTCGAIYDPGDYEFDVERFCEHCRNPLPQSL